MDDINWWEERLQAWAHEGFDVEDFRITLTSSEEDASHLILEFEKKVQQNRTLRRRIIDSTLLPDKKGEWLSMLDDVSSTSEVQEKWEKDAEKYRPWEPYIHRSEGKWLERGRRSNLSAIVKRLNSLDPSSYAACQPLLILFDDVSSESLIKSMLDDIEADESRRKSVVNEMIALLNSEGIDASDARGMEISSALDYLSSMQQKAGNLRELDYRNADTNNPLDAAGRFNMDFTIIYFQDTWDISSDLTARIGFRYEEISMDSVPDKNTFWYNWTGDTYRAAPENDVNLDGEDILMPRFSLDWQAQDNVLVTFGWGEFSGNLPPVWYGGPYIDTGLGLPGNKLRAKSNNLPTPGTPESYPGDAALNLVRNEIGDTGGYTNMMDKDFGIPSITKLHIGVTADLESNLIGSFTLRANYMHMK